MPKQCLDWNKMFSALQDYRKRHGNCNVPANWKENPQLGRWVASMRYRRKVEGLPPDQVKKLDSINFIWAPSDAAWNKMYDLIVAFKKKHGHCNVPAQWKGNAHLASWVANQRHRHKMGTMTPEREKKLTAIKFEWAIYGAASEPVRAPKPALEPTALCEEKLYVIASGVYVQFNGDGKLPLELEKYSKTHRGELPPYIPLPTMATKFIVNENAAAKPNRIVWCGKGRLPRTVLDYVCENGVLPPQG